MNKHYVMTDLHGNYDDYLAMLQSICFDKSDTLYILGDLCDRGPEAAKLYLDVMNRENVFCIMGNHEKMAVDALEGMVGQGLADPALMANSNWFSIALWVENGGQSTAQSLLQLSPEDRARVLNFIRELPLHRTLKLGDREYVMVHGGLSGYTPEKALEDYDVDDLVWDRPDQKAHFWPGENKVLLVGHTPTFYLQDQKPAAIYRGGGNVIFLDCGAAYKEYGGRLGCLCLETGEEFYV